VENKWKKWEIVVLNKSLRKYVVKKYQLVNLFPLATICKSCYLMPYKDI